MGKRIPGFCCSDVNKSSHIHNNKHIIQRERAGDKLWWNYGSDN